MKYLQSGGGGGGTQLWVTCHVPPKRPYFFSLSFTERPRGVLQKNLKGFEGITGMLKVEFKISTIYIPRKAWFLWPISIPFFCKKHPIWGKLGTFLAKFSKIHPILQIGRIGYVRITHPSIYQNLRKCTSKPLSIPVYHLSVRTPRGKTPIFTNFHPMTPYF